MTDKAALILKDKVYKEWVDYNGHMNDASYATVFSKAVDSLMDRIGIDEIFRNDYHYSIYTLETHITYLMEAHEKEPLEVTVQILDYDSKRIHSFFVMKNRAGDRLATSEQMLMGMDMKEERPAPFPVSIMQKVEQLAEASKGMEKPKEAGRKIGIRRK